MSSLINVKQKNLYAIYRNNISQENKQNTLASILIRSRIAGREVTCAFRKTNLSCMKSVTPSQIYTWT